MDQFKKEQRLINQDKIKTEINKNQFIKEIRNGLGEHIKNNSNNFPIIRKTPFRRFLDKLMEIF